MTIDARDKVNKEAGTRRMFAHAIFTPGQPGWLEKLDHALALKPDSFKGYTIGDNTNKHVASIPAASTTRRSSTRSTSAW